MNEVVARAGWIAIGLYLAAGLAFAVAFLARGVERIDPAAVGSPLGFRLLLVPGTAALWPLLARRWLGRQTVPPEQTDAHVRAAAREVPR